MIESDEIIVVTILVQTKLVLLEERITCCYRRLMIIWCVAEIDFALQQILCEERRLHYFTNILFRFACSFAYNVITNSYFDWKWPSFCYICVAIFNFDKVLYRIIVRAQSVFYIFFKSIIHLKFLILEILKLALSITANIVDIFITLSMSDPSNYINIFI